MTEIQETGTESRILAAAEEVFLREGFDGARMQGIAETAGINKALLHYYFRSKQGLFERVLQAKMLAFLPEISAAFNSRHTAYDKIEAFVDGYLKMLRANPQLPMFVMFSIHRNPAFVDQLPISPFQPLIAYLQSEIDGGRMRPVDPTHFLISVLSMCIFPFISRHLASHMMGKDADAYAVFLSERKTQIMHFVKAVMTP